MSRRRPRSGPAKPATPASRAPRPREPRTARPQPNRFLVRGVAALVLLAGVVALACHPWRSAPPRDPLAGMDVNAAADSADALDKRGKFVEALRYVEYLERVGQLTAAFESRAATAANNASIQVREQHGLAIPATRSSIERVALIRQSIARAQRAEDMVQSPGMKGAFQAARAGQIAVWGFEREAFAGYRRAAALGPLPQRALSEARWVSTMLRDPTTVVPLKSAVAPAAVEGDSSMARPAP